jgi:hypothetical protein
MSTPVWQVCPEAASFEQLEACPARTDWAGAGTPRSPCISMLQVLRQRVPCPQVLSQREVVFQHLKQKLDEVAGQVGERVLLTPSNSRQPGPHAGRPGGATPQGGGGAMGGCHISGVLAVVQVTPLLLVPLLACQFCMPSLLTSTPQSPSACVLALAACAGGWPIQQAGCPHPPFSHWV